MMGLLGEANVLAARGSFLHMVNHSLFKLLLFLVAAVIGMKTGITFKKIGNYHCNLILSGADKNKKSSGFYSRGRKIPWYHLGLSDPHGNDLNRYAHTVYPDGITPV